jgi:hypothetical protein
MSPRYNTVAFSTAGTGVKGSGIGWVGATVGAAVGSAVGGNCVAEATGTVADGGPIVSVSSGADVAVGPAPEDEQAAARPAAAATPTATLHHRALRTFAIAPTGRPLQRHSPIIRSAVPRSLTRTAVLREWPKFLPKEEENITRSHGHCGRILVLL